jgi:hypothetical protein
MGRLAGEDLAIAIVDEGMTESIPEMALADKGRDSDMAPGFRRVKK